MRTFSRRAVLRDGIFAAGSALLGPFAQVATHARGAGGNGKILVIIQLAGGNDGLHTIVPYTDPLYKQLRPTLAVAANQVIPLNAQLGLHPMFASLKPMWDANQMAIVMNVGYPQPNLSHFQSMYIWQTLDLTGAQGTATTGWLGNYISGLGVANTDPFAGLDSGATILPSAFMAPNISVPAINNPATFGIAPDKLDTARSAQRTATLLKFYQSFSQANGDQQFGNFLNTTAQTSTDASAQLAKAAASYKPGVPYPANVPLAANLKLIATAITQNLNLSVGYVTIGGFDTHANEVKTLDTLYKELADAVAIFYQDLAKQGVADKVVTMTWSEFGRRVKENGSQGTDHGTASPLFIWGPAVKGGIYGDPPNLGDLDQSGNLKFKIDFRQIYATVLAKWLGADSTKILNGTYNQLAFLS